ncbi:uncharacterized protein [Lolium perenne]|uniref:uncharacterized protein n=1 Tax=Lolium perenne TaxID=4522 RepID=UPI003A99526F
MEHLARAPTPRSRMHYLTAEGIYFKITVTLRASRVEKWIRVVKRDFLDAAPIKCVGLDCEFTNPREGNQHAAFLQLSVATDTSQTLYDLANSTIGTKLEKKKRKRDKKKNKKRDDAKEKEDELIFEMANVPLSYEQVNYTALDARHGFEMARRYWRLVGYNSHVDRLNI